MVARLTQMAVIGVRQSTRHRFALEFAWLIAPCLHQLLAFALVLISVIRPPPNLVFLDVREASLDGISMVLEASICIGTEAGSHAVGDAFGKITELVHDVVE